MLDRAPLYLTVVSLLLALGTSACTKTEAQTSETSPSATTTATAAPNASTGVPTGASAATTASAAASASAASPAASASPSASTAAAGSASGAAPAASANAACGTKPLPDCPLQAWMKANTNPPMAANDSAALAIALDKVATFAPAGYTNWASIAKDGAKAAKGGDMTAAKASCRTCHDQYKTKYKTELRARKI